MKEGVLVGADLNQEWLLPWWWGHFHAHNPSTPVAFADFGMSARSRRWCEEKGEVVFVPESMPAPPLDDDTLSFWVNSYREEKGSGFLAMRKAWFKKPIAMSLSPFQRTLWLDLDCEVRGNLSPLFSHPLSPARLAAASSEINLSLSGKNYPHYNGGVVLFEKNSPFLPIYVQAIPEVSRVACGDDDLLSILIAHYEIPIVSLPLEYNWEVLKFGHNPGALIYHWIGEKGKQAIKNTISGKNIPRRL